MSYAHHLMADILSVCMLLFLSLLRMVLQTRCDCVAKALRLQCNLIAFTV